MTDDHSPGWIAIQNALDAIHPQGEAMHWGTLVRWRLGGPDPLDGISAFDAGDHWHYVSFGMTELYEKESDLEDVSGWGAEFTFRLTKEDDHVLEPPVWPANLLQNLARYVFQSGNVFQPGHQMDLNGPIAAGRDTQVTAASFAWDPQLSEPVDGQFGQFRFLQIVGITADELTAIRSWNGESTLALMQEQNRLLATTLSRASHTEDEAFMAKLEEGRRADGSSSGGIFTDALKLEKKGGLFRGPKRIEVTLGALVVDPVTLVLRGRIPFDREFVLAHEAGNLRFEPGTPGARMVGNDVVVTLDAPTTETLCDVLQAQRGEYTVDGLPGVVFRVHPTYVKDSDGEVVQVVG